jgi:hypothetical protein
MIGLLDMDNIVLFRVTKGKGWSCMAVPCNISHCESSTVLVGIMKIEHGETGKYAAAVAQVPSIEPTTTSTLGIEAQRHAYSA